MIIDGFRLTVGLLARGVFWVCLNFIVLNAVAQAIKDTDWGLALIELVAFPLTALIYPFVAEPFALAWPLPDGTTFVPFLVIALICYPVSTLIGGLEPVD